MKLLLILKNQNCEVPNSPFIKSYFISINDDYKVRLELSNKTFEYLVNSKE